MSRGNPGLTGLSPEDSLKPPLRRRWVCQTPAAFFKAEPCVAAGKVFLRTYAGGIIALDAETGKPVWMQLEKADKGTRFSAFCCDGKRLFFSTKKGGVFALDAGNGTFLWKYAFNSPRTVYQQSPMPILAEGKIFFTRVDEKGVFAVALKPQDGTEIWTARLGASGWNLRRELCYAEGMIYASASIDKDGPQRGSGHWSAHEGCVVALRAKDGSMVWKREDLPGGGAEHAKVLTCVSDGRIVCCTAPYKHQAQVLDAKTGKTLWTTRKGRHAAWFVIAGDKVLTGCNGVGSCFSSYETMTGKYLGFSRSIRIGASNCAVPAVAGGYAFGCIPTPNVPLSVPAIGRYAMSSVGVVDLATREIVWSYRLEGNACASPAIAYGRMYVCGTGGWVFCFEPVAKEELSYPTPDITPASLRETQKKRLGKPQGPGRAATFKGSDKSPGGKSWPMYGGCPERCGLELSIKTPLTFAWKFDTGGEVHSSAAIHDGLAFVGSDSGKLFALDLTSGKKKWEFKAGGPVHCSPAAGKGVAVVGADDGKLYAVEVESGKKKWEFKTGDFIRAAPAIVGDTVIFGSWDHRVYALNVADGRQLWCCTISHRIHAAPAVYKNRVFVGGADWVVYALNLTTGKPEWHRILRGPVRGTAVFRDMLVVPYMTRGAAMAYLCPENGEAAMKQVRLGGSGALFGTPAFNSDWLIYGRWHNGGPGIVNLREEKSYSRAAAAGCLETPLCAGNTMILASIKGTVEAYALAGNPKRPDKLWEWKTPSGKMFRTTPSAAGGYIVVGNTDGFVYGFQYGKH